MTDQIEPLSTTTQPAQRRPSVQEAEAAIASSERRDSLASTPNPTNPDHITTENASKSDIPPTSSVGQQNAPGKLGKAGEAVMGGFGYGGATVQRPPGEQGLGEKIVNFLGA